jgi:hypothetical protein
MKAQYLLIKQRLASITELELIDLYLNQYAQTGEDAVLASPAIYIELLPTDWESYPSNQQRGLFTFRTHLVIQSAHGNENDLLDDVFVKLPELAAKTFKALHNRSLLLSQLPGYTGPDCALLDGVVRVRSEYLNELSNLVVHIDTWQARTIDLFAVPETTTVMAALQASFEFVDRLD